MGQKGKPYRKTSQNYIIWLLDRKRMDEYWPWASNIDPNQFIHYFVQLIFCRLIWIDFFEKSQIEKIDLQIDL